eukprot:3804631-Pleurochrysis_carterae.AAC.1
MERDAWTAWACVTQSCTGSTLGLSATGSSLSIGEGGAVPHANAQWPASVARARVGDEQAGAPTRVDARKGAWQSVQQ